MSFIHSLDIRLFHYINGEWHNTLSDAILPLLRIKENWIPFYLLLIFLVVRTFGKTGWMIVLMAGLCVGTADLVSSSVMKPFFQRERPCNDLDFKDNVRMSIPCGSGYSFPSSHASNHFALAAFLVFLLGRKRKGIILPLFLWAFSIAYAQVYVGIHYPTDIMAGALLGCLMGWIFVRISAFFFQINPNPAGPGKPGAPEVP